MITVKIYIESIIAAVIGILIHFVVRMIKSKRRADAAKITFSYKKAIQDDGLVLISNILGACAIVYILPNLLNWKPEYAGFVRPFYIFAGYSGSSVVLAALSAAEKRTLKEIKDATQECEDDKK